MESPGFSALCASLSAKQVSGEWRCRCPAHDDSDPSLWLRQADDGKILLHCFAGCSQDSVIGALRDQGLWAQTLTAVQRKTPDGIPFFWPPSAVLRKKGVTPSAENQKAYSTHYTYRNLNNEIVGHVARYEGHGKKDTIPFFQRWEQTGAWRSGLGQKNGRPLFNAEKLLAPRGVDFMVVIVEGEKCAQAITDLSRGVLGLTWCGGSSAYGKAAWSSILRFLEGVPVLIWPDNDAPGRKAANGIASLLIGLAPRLMLSTVDLSQFGDIPNGWDCADWIEAGAVPEAVRSLALLPVVSAEPSEVQASEPEAVELTPSSPVARPPLTDVGNAIRFVASAGPLSKFVPGVGWHFFNGQIWEVDPCEDALGVAARVAGQIEQEAAGLDEDAAEAVLKWARQSQSVTKLDAMLRMAKSHREIILGVDALDPDREIVSAKNGVVNLATGEIRPGTPEDLCSKLLDFEYSPSAECPLWENFIRSIMLEKPDMINFIQRAVGYSLSGDCSEQKMFFCYGPSGSNGKSVFLEVLYELAGGYATQTPIDLILLKANGDESASNTIARLRGARLVNGNEVPKGARLNESRIKELTGEDTIAARFLFKEFFEFRPQCKFWIRSNYRPEIRSQDNGIWRRMITIPFDLTVEEAHKDKRLKDKLLKELPGIFNWAMRGYQLWKESGLQVPAPSLAATAEYKEDMDILGAWLAQRCTLEPDSKVSASALYESYKDWCKTSGENPVTMRKLMLAIKDRGIKRIHCRDARYYEGIKLRTDINSGEVSSDLLQDGFPDDGFNF